MTCVDSRFPSRFQHFAEVVWIKFKEILLSLSFYKSDSATSGRARSWELFSIRAVRVVSQYLIVLLKILGRIVQVQQGLEGKIELSKFDLMIDISGLPRNTR